MTQTVTDTDSNTTVSVAVAPTEPIEIQDVGGSEEISPEPEVEGEAGSNELVANKSLAIKALGANRVGAYGILWGDDQHRDLYQEWFTPETEELTKIFDAMGGVPYLVEHADDDEVKTVVVGKVDVMVPDDKGLWWEAKILEHDFYREQVNPLIEREALYSSSGTLPRAKRKTEAGEITRWPIAEMTATTMPAEYRMLSSPISELESHYKSAGLVLEIETSEETSEADLTNGAEKARLGARINQSKLRLQLAKFDSDF